MPYCSWNRLNGIYQLQQCSFGTEISSPCWISSTKPASCSLFCSKDQQAQPQWLQRQYWDPPMSWLERTWIPSFHSCTSPSRDSNLASSMNLPRLTEAVVWANFLRLVATSTNPFLLKTIRICAGSLVFECTWLET